MTATSNRREFLRNGVASIGAGFWAATGPSRAWCASGNAMPFDEYSQHDAVALARLVKRGEVSPLELLTTAIERAETVNPKINAIIGDREEQYDFARRSIKLGVPNGPLAGVPFLLKDLSFALNGFECSNGSRLFVGHRPTRDSTAVDRYRRAGLVIFGRTHSPEFGIMPATESVLYGTTRNPWNLDRTAGGSSGGSAAAIASRIVPAASGSDGGGSIRIPASCCGLFGLKPTRERIPAGYPHYGGIVCVHALTRSVRDSAALLDATKGPVAGSTSSPPQSERPYLEEVGRAPRRLRIGVVTENLLVGELHQECSAALTRAIKICHSLGHDVEDITEHFNGTLDWQEMLQAQVVLFTGGLIHDVTSRLKQLGRKLAEGDVEPGTFDFIRSSKLTAADYAKALQASADASHRLANLMLSYDVLLMSTLGKPPIGHGILTAQKPTVDVQEIVSFIPFTFLANFTGVPAMSVPLHWTSDHLPVGVQFFGRYGGEATLFRLAGQLESEAPWAHRVPKEV